MKGIIRRLFAYVEWAERRMAYGTRPLLHNGRQDKVFVCGMPMLLLDSHMSI